MKSLPSSRSSPLVWLAAVCLALPAVSSSLAQGTAFTYQGRLSAAGAFANGTYDIQFALFSTKVTGRA